MIDILIDKELPPVFRSPQQSASIRFLRESDCRSDRRQSYRYFFLLPSSFRKGVRGWVLLHPAFHSWQPGVWGVFPCLSIQRICTGTAEGLAGHTNPVYASGVIHGKTGPLPKGALLFGPFSYAHKKKDVNNIKTKDLLEKTGMKTEKPVVCFSTQNHASNGFFLSPNKKGRGRKNVELRGKSAYPPRTRFHSTFL